jgi:hypothetical protein
MLRRLLACALVWTAGCAAGSVVTDIDAAVADAGLAGEDAPVAILDAPPPAPPDARPDARIDGPPPDARPDARVLDARLTDAARADAACTVNLLENGDFDATVGAGGDKSAFPWVGVQTMGERPWLIATAEELAAVGATPSSGGYAAHLGGGDNLGHALLTTVTIPSNARTLRFHAQLWVRSDDPPSPIDDVMTIDLTDPEGVLVERLAALSEADRAAGWAPRTVRAGQHGGRTLVLAFTVRTSGAAPTDFFVDDVRLEITLCD